MAFGKIARIDQAMGLTTLHRETAADFDRSVPVLVLGFGDYPFLHGTLGMIRSLGRLGIPVYTLQRNSFIADGASRYLAGKFIWSMDGEDRDRFLAGMATISKTLDRPTILVPADDLSAILIAENADALASRFIFVRQRPALPRTLANKRNLYHLCQQIGFPCPPTVFPGTREELLAFAEHTRFPVVVKAAEPWLLPKGFKSVAIVSRRQDLIEYYENFAQRSPATTLMIQEMIPARGSEDWIVHGYCDAKSEPSVLFTGVKLRSYPAFAGPTTLARSVRNDALQQQAIKLFSAIGYRGIMDLDLRLDGRDGRYNLLDFNPRVGAQFTLFSTDTGIDVIRALHLDLTGRRPCGGRPIEGRTFTLDIQDLFAGWAYYRSGDLRVRDWLRSLRGADQRAWYAADDPSPFLLMCLGMALRTLRRKLGLSNSKKDIEAQPRFISRFRQVPKAAPYRAFAKRRTE
jgi:D-aspartate ligase